jgi:hypothetical protein
MNICICIIKESLPYIETFVKVAAVTIGGLWVLYLRNSQREAYPHIEFTADVVFHKKIDGYWITELLAYVENKGKVRHKIYRFELKLESILQGEKVEVSKDPSDRKQVKFGSEPLIESTYMPYITNPSPSDRNYFFY